MPSFKDSGRVEYVGWQMMKTVQALLLSKTEGILPAIESSHAIAEVQTCSTIGQGQDYYYQCLWTWG